VIQVASNRTPAWFWRVSRTAVLIKPLNPKLTIFFFVFLPRFLPAAQPNGTWQMLSLSGVFMALTFVTRPSPAMAIPKPQKQSIDYSSGQVSEVTGEAIGRLLHSRAMRLGRLTAFVASQ
jgi:threonine/homoserine/homoserine lactone efflux protein